MTEAKLLSSGVTFLKAGGELGALMRAHDWAATPLGDLESWPQAMRAAVQLCLNTPIISAVYWGPDLRILYNDAYAPALAERHPWALGRPLHEVWAEIWDVLRPQIADVVETGRGFSTDHQLLKMNRNGRLEDTYWVYSFAPLHDDGAVAGVFVTALDTTGQVLAERRTAERTAERDRMWETSPDLMLVIYFGGAFRRVNPAWRTVLGYAPEELVGHHVNEFVLPDDQSETTDAYKLAAAGGRPMIVNRYRHKDGSVRWISWTAAPAGDLTYATGRDITGQRRQAAELAERTSELERTWQLSQDMLVINEPDGSLAAVNEAWTKALGWTGHELVGKTFMELAHPDDVEPTLERFKAVFERPLTDPYEYRLRHKDGSYRWIAWTAAFHGGRIFANGRDVTERRERQTELEAAQGALRQSQKMEAMGSLTGGVAHDFNNLLTPIIGSLDMLVRKGLGGERERRLIDGALQSAERAKTLVQRLLAFARRQPLQPRAVDLAPLVQDMVGLIQSTLGPSIAVQMKLGDQIPAANADPNQLEMALLNLAVNARDAMPTGGVLTIETKLQRLDASHRTDLPTGNYILLCVTDDGAGMDEATRARAIEPFFSTKGIGKGTGLGLSMVHGLAAQLGGALLIDSAPDQGTTIELWLPVSGEKALPNTAPTFSSEPQYRGTVLLVDDELLVRMSTADMLLDLGFEVIEAASAEEALRVLSDNTTPDILITDHFAIKMLAGKGASPGRYGVRSSCLNFDPGSSLPFTVNVLLVPCSVQVSSLLCVGEFPAICVGNFAPKIPFLYHFSRHGRRAMLVKK